jgi:hypothetical protein
MQLTKKQLKDLAARKITKRALAAQLGVSETYLVRCTPALPPGKTQIQRRANSVFYEARREFRTKMAKQVMSRRRSLESAAKEANCSTRTMYRYICKLKSQ